MVKILILMVVCFKKLINIDNILPVYSFINFNQKILLKDFNFILCISLISFFLSANIAWLNPYPDTVVYKVIENIPLFWQYNRDVPVEILSSTGFLEYFDRDPTRIERPGLPLLAYLIGNLLYFLLNKLINLPIIYFTAGAYILVNFILHLFSSICLYKILKIYFSENTSKIGVIIFFLNFITIRHFAEIHTNSMHVISPILLTFFLLNFLNKEKFIYLFIFSLVAGFLILIKSIYSFYLAILIFLLFKRKYLDTILSIILHFIPIVVWLIILNFKEIEFYSAIIAGNVEGQTTEMVTWFVNDLVNLNIINIISQFLISIKSYIEIFFLYYNFLIFFICFGIYEFLKKSSKYKKDFLIFIIIVFFVSFVQFYLTRKNLSSIYMGGDYFLICIFFILFYLKNIEPKKILITTFLLFIFLINTIKLPYISPFKQQKVEWEKKFKPNSKSLNYFK